jgi:hypothetical protein
VELSPYWLAPHPGLTWKGYVGSGFFDRLYQNMSLSFGTSTVGMTDPATDQTQSATNVAVGIRTGLDSRWDNCPGLDPLQDEFHGAASRQKLQAMDTATAGGGHLSGFDQVGADFKKKWLEDRVRARALKQATQQCTRKRGFAVDAAFATAFTFPEQQLEKGELSALATWLTFGALGDTVSFAPMVRFRSDMLEMDNARSVLDLGGQGVLAVQRFAFSAELVYRLVVDKPAPTMGDDGGHYLADIGVDAALTEDIWFNITVGKDFSDLVDEDRLFARTSLRFDLGERTLRIDPDATGRER